MKRDENFTTIQAMPLIYGKTGLTSGTHDVQNVIECVEDGTLQLTDRDGNTWTFDAVATLPHHAFAGTVTIQSGKFNLD